MTPWTAAFKASLYITVLHSLLKLMSIESVMKSWKVEKGEGVRRVFSPDRRGRLYVSLDVLWMMSLLACICS